MKSFFLILAVVSIHVFAETSDERKQKIAAFTNHCIVETGIDGNIVQNALQGNIVEDPKLKTFAFCMTKKAGLQNANGDVQIEELKKQLPNLVDNPEATIELVTKCLGKEGTPEDIAFETFTCYYKNNPNRQQI
ncbi:B1 protein-like [Rhynchophorus ferrugineus]|uniref:Uncharacterized protein n=1 Tax=Rhynchophorus ferrugineus TaxID=354439 RepID=A0A834MC02_RHYFE|nr:hypothetical protein GWI33_014826 [Rhynchophorus ferrugineus]